MSEPDYIPLKTAAAKVGCHIETLRREVRAKRLTVLRVGRAYQTTEHWLQAWLDTKTINAPATEAINQG